jgi:vacuolar-type H+-ATPase catalytic subunit A/Vma1
MNRVATELIETGIKAVDLYAPLRKGGSLAIHGDPGAGEMVLAFEIVHNVCAHQAATCVFHVGDDAEQFRSALRESGVDAEVVADESPTRADLHSGDKVLGHLVLADDARADSWVVLSLSLLKTGQLPAIDASRSGTRLDLGSHGQVAQAAREAIGAATGARAGGILAFLRQWFHVAEPWTGQPAEYSTLGETIAGVRQLLAMGS